MCKFLSLARHYSTSLRLITNSAQSATDKGIVALLGLYRDTIRVKPGQFSRPKSWLLHAMALDGEERMILHWATQLRVPALLALHQSIMEGPGLFRPEATLSPCSG